MTDESIRRLALILSVQAEIDGMKTYNKMKIVNKEKPFFEKCHFDQKAENLRNLAYSANECMSEY